MGVRLKDSTSGRTPCSIELMPPRIIGGTAGRTLQIRVVDGAEAAGVAAPETDEDGFSLATITREFKFEDRGQVVIHNEGEATGVEVASASMWGFLGEGDAAAGPNDWGLVGSGSESIGQGALNEGLAIAQTGARKIMLIESVGGLLTLDRVAFQLGAVSADTGDPSVHVDLFLTRRVK